MIELIIASLIIVIFVGGLSFLMNRYAEFWYRTLIVKKLEQINTLMLTEEVPASWRVPILDKWAHQPPSPSWRLIRDWVWSWYIYRLDDMARSVQHASYLSKDEKAEFAQAFSDIRASWQQQADNQEL